MRPKAPSMRLLVVGISMPALFPIVTFADVVTPDDINILYTGRIDFSTRLAPAFGWPGTSLIANFEGTSIAGTFDDDGNNYVYVIIDDGEPNTLNLNPGITQYTLASDLPDAIHQIEIVKKTEGGLDNDFTFLGFELDSGKTLVAPPARPLLRLEFYGDSNASGYSCECTCDSGDAAYRNNYFSFVGTTSRLLDAEYSCISWSGIGIAVTAPIITGVWDRVLPTSASPAWDFHNFTPDAVVINLGANDYYWGVSQPVLIDAWVGFVTDYLRPVYPDAHVCLVNSFGWAYQEPADYVHIAVANLHAAGDTNVSYVLFPWLWGQQHAVICEHAGFANILAEHLATELGMPPPLPARFSCLGDPGQVANGGFENGSATEVDGWRDFTYQYGATAVIEDAASAHSGTRYIEASVGTRGYAGFYQGTAGAPGVAYTATAYMKANAGRVGKLKIEFKDQAQHVIQTVEGEKNVTGSWAQYTTTSDPAPANTVQVTVVCVTDSSDNIIQFDDVVLAPVGGIVPGDGDFEPDGDVDLADLAAFQRCFGELATGSCDPGDLTGSGATIDLDDLMPIVEALTGPH